MLTQKLCDHNYLIVLNKGDKVIKSLTKWAEENNVGAAAIVSGIGGTGNIHYGSTKPHEYVKRVANEFPVYEVTTIIGNISKVAEDNSTKVHAHITFSDENFKVYAGHLFEMDVEITAEIFVRVYENRTILRRANPNIPHLMEIKEVINN